MQKILLILLVLSLAACNVTPHRRDTYDLIGSEMDKAVASKAKPAQPDVVSASLLPPLNIEIPKPHQRQDEHFNVAFNNAPAQQFFLAIASGTRYNMLVHPEVTGTISANLKDVTIFEALDAIREIYGYEYKVEGTRIYVMAPMSLQTRVFKINYLNSVRKGASDIRVTSGSVTDSSQGSSSGSTQTITSGTSGTTGSSSQSLTSSKINTVSNYNFWDDLKASLAAIVGEKDGRSVVINPLSGVIVIRAMPNELRNVDAYLKATQVAVDRQVILEAKIMEVQLNETSETGINWSAFAKNLSVGFMAPGTSLSSTRSATLSSTGDVSITSVAGTSLSAASTAAGSLFGLAFQTGSFAALISLLESQGTVHVLSSPRIATMNNQKAVLKVGTDQFFVTKVSTSQTTTGTTTTTPTTSVEVQPFFSGVALDVTPQIDQDDNIVLHIHPSVSKVSTVTTEVSLGSSYGTLSLPLASSDVSETDSVVRGKNGSVIAIGGLMRQSSSTDNSEVPGASDVPVLGALFRNNSKVSKKRELVILIKPIVVQGDSTWANELANSQQRIQSLDPKAFQKSEPKPSESQQ